MHLVGSYYANSTVYSLRPLHFLFYYQKYIKLFIKRLKLCTCMYWLAWFAFIYIHIYIYMRLLLISIISSVWYYSFLEFKLLLKCGYCRSSYVSVITILLLANAYKYRFLQARSQNCEKRLLASSCLSVCPHATTRLPLDGFSRNLIFEYFFFRKHVEKIQVSLKSDKNNGYFTWRTLYIFDHISLNSSKNE